MTKAAPQKEFLINNVLLNDLNDYSEEVNTRLKELRRQSTKKPVIYIGTSTCGIVAGAMDTRETIEQYISERGIETDIVETGCIGLCTMEPIVDVRLPGKTRVSFRNITSEKVTSLLDDAFHNKIQFENVLGQYRNHELKDWDDVPFLDEMPFFALQHRIVLKDCGIISTGIEEYIATGGYHTFIKTIKNYPIEEVCKIVEDSGLRGRAGGGFPTGTKWKVALHTPSDQKYLVCNAEESDPGAFMDRTIIEGNPHRLLEGIAIASYAINASKAVIYIRSEYNLATQRLKQAIAEAYEYGLLGNNIMKSGFQLDISLRIGPGAFVCGEETALINSLEGKRGMPKTKPPFPAQQGLGDKPTVINNVETLANIPDILKNGPQWFREIGTRNSKGTKVFSISGRVKYTGLIEVPMGTSLFDIVFRIAGGVLNDKDFKALHIGGPSGCTLTRDQLNCGVDYEALKDIGALMGSGGLLVLDEHTCMLDLTKFFMHFMSRQSCGKCIPCREGTKRIFEILDQLTRKPEDAGHRSLDRFKGVMQLENLARVMKDASLCGLGQNAANPLISTLKWFKDEYDEHIFERHCKAGVCKDLKHYTIDVDACTGCSVCAKKCPTDAIIGSPRNPYFIVQEKCIGCGECYTACKFGAVIVE